MKRKEPEMEICSRKIGPENPPLVIAEIGINHEGSVKKAARMIDDAHAAGCECVKFQSHIIEDEMVPLARKVIPANTKESIWEIMQRCSLTEKEERELKKYTESKNMIYLSTPFSRAAAQRLKKMGLKAYKIGSGECNNYPLIKHIAAYGKPVILSTGMNDIPAIKMAVNILRKARVHFAIMHCTSIYPTPYEKVRLGAISDLKKNFPDAILGLSDHSFGIYTCLASVVLGASILEKHFTSDKRWPGPDISISMDPAELKCLIEGSRAVHQALGGKKDILAQEQPTIDFAYACVVTTKNIKKGDKLSTSNIWVKRPGTGQIKARHYEGLLGKAVKRGLPVNEQLKWGDLANE